LTSLAIDFGLAAGFVVLLILTLILNEAGNVLYRKRIVKPFYLLGYRLHHRSILLAVMPVYVGVVALLELHYVRLLWYSLWPGIEIALALSVACMAVDAGLDTVSKEKSRALLHHEWVYLVVPAYIFTHLIAFV
jgi:hypothetical protein